MTDIGIIAIGRNEGERLRRCLTSVVGLGYPVVYVDSKSTDGSPEVARSVGAEVVDLDMSIPFSAARARNEGFERLLRTAPGLKYIQFIDGDCEVVAGWLDRARGELTQRPEVAAVCGRRRERFPGASLYNRLADLEWETPVGEAKSVGGDSMMRIDAFRQVGGYNATVVAGEEPELCQRLREAGWKILRVDAEMTLHDAAIAHFGQWWKRSVRGGYGAMDVVARFSRGRDGLFVGQVRSARAWVIWIPAVVIGSFALMGIVRGLRLISSTRVGNAGEGDVVIVNAIVVGWFAAGIVCVPAIYCVQAVRMAARCRRRVETWRIAIAYGVLTMVGKFASIAGQRHYWRDRAAGRNTRLIDYKAAASGVATASTSVRA